MLVRLRRMFFGPDGGRYRPGVREVPDSFEKCLPHDATVLQAPKPEAPKPEVKAAKKAVDL